MIARHDAQLDRADLWSTLAAPLPSAAIAWRQDGRAVQRDGRWFARFVAYVDANTVRERLDAVVPGEWDLTLDLLPPLPAAHDDELAQPCSFKARLQILGVIREDVGTGRDYKAAATDAFKRAAVRFGIAHELYAMDANWVAVDGEGRHARPLEDPAAAHARRGARRASGNGAHAPAADAPARELPGRDRAVALPSAIDELPASEAGVATTTTEAEPSCPKCGGRMWDNRLTKRNPKAPDFKCRDRSCDGVVWPPRGGQPAGAPGGEHPDEEQAPAPSAPQPASSAPAPKRGGRARTAVAESALDASPLGVAADDDLPF